MFEPSHFIFRDFDYKYRCPSLCIYYYSCFFSFFYSDIADNIIYLAFFYKILQNARFFYILILQHGQKTGIFVQYAKNFKKTCSTYSAAMLPGKEKGDI